MVLFIFIFIILDNHYQFLKNGNYFGYLEPITTPSYSIHVNTIEVVDESLNDQVPILDVRTRNHMLELYKCYYLAKLSTSKPSPCTIRESTYNIWNKRNPNVKRRYDC